MANRPEDDKRDEEVPAGLKRFFGGNWRDTAKYYEAATSLIGGLLGLGALGWLADWLMGTKPKLTLVGLLVGGVFGFYWLGRAMFARR